MIKIILFLCLSLFANAQDKSLTIERIFQSPELDGASVINLQFAKSGDRLSFLKPKADNYEVLDLWEYDLKTGQPRLLVDSNSLKFAPLSEADKARRERMRISRKGIVEYVWSNLGTQIVFPASNDLYLYNLADKKLTALTSNSSPEMDVQFSPLDTYVTFVREQNLYVIKSADRKEIAVTKDGKGDISNGLAEFIAQEEMGRFTGFWWSQNEKYLAYTQVDESPVQKVNRYDIDADKVTVKEERYPQAGTANVTIKLAVVKSEDFATGKIEPVWIDLGKNKDIYLADAAWNSDQKLIYQVQSRDQKKLDIFSYDPVSKTSKLLFTETDSKWVNLNSNNQMLKKSSRFIWSSERSGFEHLYLYDNNGKQLRQLTHGDWAIDGLMGVDEVGGWVYFSASPKTPLEKHLFRVRLDQTSQPQALTTQEGWHGGRMSEKADTFVHFFSDPLTPNQVSLHKADGQLISTLSPNKVVEGHPLFPFHGKMIRPEFGSFKIPTGEQIYYRLFKPANFNKDKKYPLVVLGYGGPGSQVVNKAWGGKWGLLAQVYLQKGFVVASFDNRGSARRGKKFENYLYRAFGTVEVEDQVAGVNHLINLGFIDKDKVGFSGWSYGGYLAASLCFKAAKTFNVCVSGAPVSDFALYDTHYTERYMGKPQDQTKAYKTANILNFVPQLKGNLLVIHGMADDNVLFTNSTLLFKELQKAGKVYESIVYPGARHGVYGKENQTHLNNSILDFLERRLL